MRSFTLTSLNGLVSLLVVFCSLLVNSQTTENFTFTGSTQTWIVPNCVYEIQVVARGARGGGSAGGQGATITATIPVNPGDVLTFTIGGQGACPAAGFNGGANGGTANSAANTACGGGGATNVLLNGTPVIIAAGGGGTGGGNTNATGGAGGCLTGAAGTSPFGQGGGGATQTAGGNGGPPWIANGNAGAPGSSGLGGAGATDPCHNIAPGGGGGGGLFGGGGGGSDCFSGGSVGGGGGGGGSSLIPAGANCTQGNNTGNGSLAITYTLGVGNATATSSGPYCVGDLIELFAQAGANTYNWTGPNGFTSNVQNPTIPNASLVNAGLYSLTTETAGCILTDDVMVVVNDFPNFTVTGVNPTACAANNGQIVISGLLPNQTYNVSYNGGAATNLTTDVNGNATISNLGQGTFTDFQVGINGCATTVNTVINLIEPNAPTIDAGQNQTVCDGDQVILTAINPQNANVSWSGGIQNGVPFTPSVGVNTYTVTAELNNCVNTDQVTVTVNALPSISAGADFTACQGAGITLTANNPGGANILWSNGVQNGVSFVPNTTGNITYTVTATLNGCQATDDITVNIISTPTFNLTATNVTSCTINDGTITLSGLIPNANYSAQINNAPAVNFTADANGNFIVNQLPPGNYAVVITDANGCSSNVVNTSISALNGPQVVNQTITHESCFQTNDGAINVTIGQGTPPYQLIWAPNVGTGNNLQNLNPGTYQLTITDAANCVTVQTFTIQAATALTMTSSTADAFCNDNDGTISLNVNGGTGNYTFNWSPSNLSGPSPSNLAPGLYSVEVVDGNGCSLSDAFEINQIGSLTVNVNPNDATIRLGNELNINTLVSGSGFNYNYTWTPEEGLSCSDCPNPIASPEETTTYFLWVEDEAGCTGMDSIKIIVIPPCIEVNFPNIFSPNDDGKHDVFCILGNCHVSAQFSIFNRWGERIFFTTSPDECWDGTFRGQPVGAGAYVYQLIYLDEHNEQHMVTGNVTLVR
ncbi:MAG: gliding motility-associated C-terminal domain-containing protein [Crocinitomicaceae bacterium]|nr:gliding motility-associated C-terminal domain-containing protein [Crocinitomicaceae bacterium]